MTWLELESSVRCDPVNGDVVCEWVDGASALTRVRATDPLKLLTPTARGMAGHVVLSTYGGGLLGGDRVALRSAVGAGARLLVTTQSSGKVYRTTGAPSIQTFTADVGAGALLAVLPDAVCAFADSRLRQRQTYDIDPSGSLIVIDWITSGRHGRGERWRMQEIDSRLKLSVGGQTRLRETLLLSAGRGDIGSLMRVGGFDCYAVVVMIGPLVRPMVDQARSAVRDIALSPRPELLASDSSLPGGAVFRMLGRDMRAVQVLLRQLFAPIDSLIGQDPWRRKW